MRKFNTKGIIFLGILTAISIVLRFAIIYLTGSLRISFINIPIILASLWFGPIAGMAVGFASDFIGASITVGWNPLLAITPVLFGLLPSLLKLVFLKKVNFWKILIIILITNIIGTMIWSTYALSVMFGTEYFALLAIRIPLYIGIATLESICIYYISVSGLDKLIFYRQKWWQK
ncbi:MAG: hypothetical protein A2Y15_01945 [Clostridiales bacterium GWF2_36_10]|nr:MAG: hypothetical protein A2Y15_01945 [Clostridiales bacterium GWF2_36_10]HAN20465.1 hypothetical protein [Clostridiales bacterium]